MSAHYCYENRDGVKCYRLLANYMRYVGILHQDARVPRRIQLRESGMLYIATGYTWDGPSGPALDTASFMQASLVHDALYELMRSGELSISYRKQADRVMRTIAYENGMPWYRRWWTYWAVRLFAGGAAEPTQ